MPQWSNILVGLLVGTIVVGIAILWACWPRKATQNYWFAPSTGEAKDPTPGGSQ